MRVALIASGFPTAEKPNSGIFNLRSAQRLRENHDVHIFHLRTWRPGAPLIRHGAVEGLPVTSVWLPQIRQSYESRMRTSINWAMAERAGWAAIGSRLVHFDILHSIGVAFAGVLTSYWSSRAQRPHVAQAIGTDLNDILPRIAGWWPIRGWERNVSAFAANSGALAGELRSRYPSAASVSVVYRGTDLARFSPPATGRTGTAVHFLFAHGFPEYGLAAGDNQRGGRTLCEAWQSAEERLVAAGATLTLAGPRSDAESVEEWRQTLGNPAAVRLAGVVDPGAMPALMRTADVLVVASMQDGLPNVAVEASASGCAVLGSRAGGIPEIVRDGETGVLLQPGDAQALATSLTHAAENPTWVHAMGVRGREFVEKQFDAAQYSVSMERVYALARAR